MVIKGKINSPLLLGRRTLIELGMLEIRPDGSLKGSNELWRTYSKAVKSILNSKAKSDIETMLQQHEEVFKGIGKFLTRKTTRIFWSSFPWKQMLHQLNRNFALFPTTCKNRCGDGLMNVSKKRYLRKWNQESQWLGAHRWLFSLIQDTPK